MDATKQKMADKVHKAVERAFAGEEGSRVTRPTPLITHVSVRTNAGPRHFSIKVSEPWV